MKAIRRFFFNEKTAAVSAFVSLTLMAAILILAAVTGQMTVFGSFILIQHFTLAAGLFVLYRRHDLIRMSAVTTGLLFALLPNQAHYVLNRPHL